jgi:UDP-GlcNAc:undecaprenyl-phosphate/decaprenyl-phosphate GlcNAc-1-phosphate transferase
MKAYYITIFLLAFFCSTILTSIVRKFSKSIGLVDMPDKDRKFHDNPTPLLGGLAIFFAFFIILYFIRRQLLSGDLEPWHWIGFFIGACWLMVGGYLDDKYKLKPGLQFIFAVLAILSVIAGGVEIEKISNPVGGIFQLDNLRIPVINFAGTWHYYVVISDTFIMLWLLGMMYTTKLLDGLDGLVTGITAIGAFIIFVFTMTTKYYQPDIGLASLVLSAACFGFLIFNWHPAKIFLGEGGSLFLGYALGVLAVISGGKIAIALLVMGIPILDVLWTIIRRLSAGKNPFRFADRGHLHFRLYDSGLGTRKTVLIYYGFSIIFGLSALFLQSAGKLFSLSILTGIMLLFVIGYGWWGRKKII